MKQLLDRFVDFLSHDLWCYKHSWIYFMMFLVISMVSTELIAYLLKTIDPTGINFYNAFGFCLMIGISIGGTISMVVAIKINTKKRK